MFSTSVAKTIKPAYDDKTGLPRLIPLTLGLALLTVATTPAQPPQAVQAPSATTRQFN